MHLRSLQGPCTRSTRTSAVPSAVSRRPASQERAGEAAAVARGAPYEVKVSCNSCSSSALGSSSSSPSSMPNVARRGRKLVWSAALSYYSSTLRSIATGRTDREQWRRAPRLLRVSTLNVSLQHYAGRRCVAITPASVRVRTASLRAACRLPAREPHRCSLLLPCAGALRACAATAEWRESLTAPLPSWPQGLPARATGYTQPRRTRTASARHAERRKPAGRAEALARGGCSARGASQRRWHTWLFRHGSFLSLFRLTQPHRRCPSRP